MPEPEDEISKPPVASSRQSPPSPADVGFVVRARHVLLLMRERWIGGLGLTLVLCGLTAFTMLRRPPVYSASAALIVDRPERVVDIKSVVDADDPRAGDTALLTHIEQMRSHTFLQRVVSSLTVAEREIIVGPPPAPAAADLPVAPVPLEVQNSQLEALLKGITVIANPRRTALISVTVGHGDPRAAQLIVNRMCDQYILHLIDRSGVSNSAALTFLRERSEELRKKVEASELALQNYRERHNLVGVEDNQNIVVERIKALSGSATDARIARLALDTRLVQWELFAQAGPEAFRRSAITENAALAALQNGINQLVSQRAVLAERYGLRHPVMQDNTRAREALEKLLQQALESHLQTTASDLRDQRDRALAQEQQLAREVAAAEKEALRLDELAVEYNVLRREVETSRQMYSQIFLRQGETAVSSQLRNTNVRIADRADLPKTSVSVSKKKIVFYVVFLALACMIGYPVLMDLADQRIKSWHDVESYLDAMPLAEIGLVRAASENERAHIVSDGKDDATAETFRALHSQIMLTSKVPLPKSILVTSTVPSEGKSFVAANMASVFATHGKRTLLVDCDFRRPSLHRAFKRDNKQGILCWLNEQGTITDVAVDSLLGIQEVSPNLFVLCSGGVSRRATELVEDARLISLVEALQRRFDIVMLDTPPAGLFADAESFARLADEIVFICRFGEVKRPHARQVLDRLGKTEATLLGVVLNAMPAGRQAEAYYYNYGYSAAKYQKEYATAEPKGSAG